MSDLNTDNLLKTLIASVATYIPSHEVEPEDDFAVVPDGYRLKDLEEYHEAPRRTRETFQAETLDGFLDYYNRYATSTSAIFAREDGLHIEAVLDYHVETDVPEWGDHRVAYDLPKSDDWKAWKRKSGQRMGQRAFAEFIEEHEPVFQKPDGAAMLEMARNFEANRNAHFSSKVNEHSGDVTLNYQSETKSKAKGQMTFPKVFTVGLRPFRGSDAYEVEARLRYRVDDEGGLTLWYDLVRPHKIVEDAFAKVLQKVKDSTEHGTTYRGAPK